MTHIPFRPWMGLSLLLAAVSVSPALAQSGIVFTGAGPINRSMGGAATAAPIDASGALLWNPAAITGLESSEMEFGAELLYPHAKLSSSVAPGALATLGPPIPLSGSTKSDVGVNPLPSVGLVYHPEDSDFTYGLGIDLVGGFAINYPGSSLANPFTANPILTPQPPGGIGLGPVFAELQILQFAPTVAVQLTDHLSFGFAPTIDLGFLEADPAFIVAPNIVNGFPEYPPGTHTETQWGAGFQLGLYYALQDWQFGSSFKSPQWFEPFRFDSVNAAGGPRTIKFDFDYPMILSEGIAYSGFENWLLTADLRYIDYRNTEGFRDRGFDATGAARGLGWDSIWGVSAGAQYRLTDFLTLRAGYSYNENPIDNIETSFNVASPVIIEHTLYVGASYRVSDNLILSAAYAHAFQNSITGPLLQPTGPIPGYNVTSTISADTFLFGATVQFGPRCSSPTGSPVAFSGSAN